MGSKITEKQADEFRVINQFQALYKVFKILRVRLTGNAVCEFYIQGFRRMISELMKLFQDDLLADDMDQCLRAMTESIEVDESLSTRDLHYFLSLPKALDEIETRLSGMELGPMAEEMIGLDLTHYKNSPISKRNNGSSQYSTPDSKLSV